MGFAVRSDASAMQVQFGSTPEEAKDHGKEWNSLRRREKMLKKLQKKKAVEDDAPEDQVLLFLCVSFVIEQPCFAEVRFVDVYVVHQTGWRLVFSQSFNHHYQGTIIYQKSEFPERSRD